MIEETKRSSTSHSKDGAALVVQAMTTPWKFEILTRNMLRLQRLKESLAIFRRHFSVITGMREKHGRNLGS
jgi:hypothetical protein